MKLLLTGVFADTSFILRDKLRALLLSTIFWVMPMMAAILFTVTMMQIKLDLMGVTWLGNLLALYVPFIVGFWLQVPAIRIAMAGSDTASPNLRGLRRNLRGLTTDVRGLRRDLLRSAWVALLGGSILFAGVLSGGVLFIVPGIWLLMRHYLFMHTTIIEGASVISSLRTAADATKGKLMSMLTIMLLLAAGEAIIQVALAFCLQIVISGYEYGLLEQTLVHALFLPLQASLLTAYYMRCTRI